MNPKIAALRYRIWAYASPRGWDVTLAELSEHLGESSPRVSATIQHAKWTGRIRRTEHDSVGDGVPGSRNYAHHLASEIVSGRVGVDP